MALDTSKGTMPAGVLGASARVLHARTALEEAERARADADLATDCTRASDRVGTARESYFAALELYFYAVERAAGRDPERDSDN
jgi:hypothetical protein